MNQQVLNSFFDELQCMEKDAQWGPLGTALKGTFEGGVRGLRQLWNAASGPAGQKVWREGARGRLAMQGLKNIAPAAAVTGAGGLGLYGGGKMLFGGGGQG
jgi:hypothetical protein